MNVPGAQTESERNMNLQDRIKLDARQYADRELKVRGWCPNGFRGPERVTGNESDRLYRRFTVECN